MNPKVLPALNRSKTNAESSALVKKWLFFEVLKIPREHRTM